MITSKTKQSGLARVVIFTTPEIRALLSALYCPCPAVPTNDFFGRCRLSSRPRLRTRNQFLDVEGGIRNNHPTELEKSDEAPLENLPRNPRPIELPLENPPMENPAAPKTPP
jgi:hypothetical protein